MTKFSHGQSGLFRFGQPVLVIMAICSITMLPPSQVQSQERAAWLSVAQSSDTIVFIDMNSLTWQGQSLTGWQVVYYQKAPAGTNWGWSLGRVNWTCGQTSSTMYGDTSYYARSSEFINRIGPETRWSENFPGTTGQEAALSACTFAPLKPATRRRVPRSVASDIASQIPPEQSFDFRGLQMNYQSGGSEAVYFYKNELYFADPSDCAKRADGSGLQAIVKFSDNGESTTVWEVMNYDTCLKMQTAKLNAWEAYKAAFIEKENPFSSVQEVIRFANKEMPWPTASKPKPPKATPSKKVSKKR